MFVSRKNLALIHFVAGEVAPGLNIAKSVHESVECCPSASTTCILLEPLSKSRIQSLALGLGHQSSLLDQRFVGTQSNVLHTKIVYTDFVRSAIFLVTSI
jgi:hypothetical protein